MLRRAPEASCGSLYACQVQFLCATCHGYIPRPECRHEVEEKIVMHGKAIRFFEKARPEKLQLIRPTYAIGGGFWSRLTLAQAPLVSPAASEVFKELGVAESDSSLNQAYDMVSGFLPTGGDAHV
jgi:hypothetical protein